MAAIHHSFSGTLSNLYAGIVTIEELKSPSVVFMFNASMKDAIAYHTEMVHYSVGRAPGLLPPMREDGGTFVWVAQLQVDPKWDKEYDGQAMTIQEAVDLYHSFVEIVQKATEEGRAAWRADFNHQHLPIQL